MNQNPISRKRTAEEVENGDKIILKRDIEGTPNEFKDVGTETEIKQQIFFDGTKLRNFPCVSCKRKDIATRAMVDRELNISCFLCYLCHQDNRHYQHFTPLTGTQTIKVLPREQIKFADLKQLKIDNPQCNFDASKTNIVPQNTPELLSISNFY